VNPMHVKRSKELDDNLPTKNDKKDALVIARLFVRFAKTNGNYKLFSPLYDAQ